MFSEGIEGVYICNMPATTEMQKGKRKQEEKGKGGDYCCFRQNTNSTVDDIYER